MPAGLQVFDDNGYNVFDSTKHTLIHYLKDVTFNATAVNNGNRTYIDIDYGSPTDDLFIVIKSDVGSNAFITYNGNHFYLYAEYLTAGKTYNVTLGVYQL